MSLNVDLGAAMSAFLSSGGTITVLDGFEYVPHRPHRDIEVVRATPEKKQDPRLALRESRIAEIRKMAKTMTAEEVQAATGWSREVLFRLGREGNFVFRKPVKPPKVDRREEARRIKREAGRAEEAKLVERICALRDVGLTRNQVAKQIGMSCGGLLNIINRNNIDFPPAYVKK